MDDAAAIRRDFARGWAHLGEAWGIAPSTAAVQGYFLLHGGPLTEVALRDALGLSHKAALGALADCERWGLIEPAAPQRSGQRGPASRSWVVVGDHWEWFRRVAASRMQRETEPVLPLVDDCMRRARDAGDADLERRMASLVSFAHEFDRAMGAVVSADAASLGHLVGAFADLEDGVAARLLANLGAVPQTELAAAAGRVATMRPSVLRGLLRLAAQPGVARILDRLA